MCDFAPGDVVVAVRVTPDKPLRHLVEGQCYTIADVRYLPAGEGKDAGPWGVQVSEFGHHEHEDADAKYWGFSSRCFRRVYRHDGSFISQCLEPVDLKVRA